MKEFTLGVLCCALSVLVYAVFFMDKIYTESEVKEAIGASIKYGYESGKRDCASRNNAA